MNGKLYIECDTCNRTLHYGREYFRRYEPPQNGLTFHQTCRDCENEARIKLGIKPFTRLGKIKEYVYCISCGKKVLNKEFEKRKYFKRYASPKDGYGFHEKCKDCELKEKFNLEWKDGLLRCHLCNKYFPEEHYQHSDAYPIRNNRDARCRACRTIQTKESKKRYTGEYALIKTLQMRYLCAKERAERHNLDFNITKEFLKELWDKQNGKCAISGIKMTCVAGNGRTPTNVSIDQINNKKGYTKDNVQLVCMAVNQMKSDLTYEQLYMFCENILKNKKA